MHREIFNTNKTNVLTKVFIKDMDLDPNIDKFQFRVRIGSYYI